METQFENVRKKLEQLLTPSTMIHPPAFSKAILERQQKLISICKLYQL